MSRCLFLLVVLVGLVVVGSMGLSRAQGDSGIDIETHAVVPERETNPARVSLVWSGGAGPYQVQSSDSLPAVWSPATGDLNGTAVTVALPADVDRRFFRVVSGDNIIPANFITSPIQGAMLTAPQQPDGRRNTDVVVSWALSTEVPIRWWIYGESEPGVAETRFFNSGSVSAETRSTTIQGIPFDGSKVTIRLWWESPTDGWTESRVIYGTEALGQITSPAPGSELDAFGEFRLAANGLDVAVWWIYVGSTVGDDNYFNGGIGPSVDPAIPYQGVPNDGSTVFVRLFWRLNGESEFESRDYLYTAKAPSDQPS